MSPKTAIAQTPSTQAYDLLSRFYDEVTGHHDYERWLSSLLTPLETHGLSGSRLLDLGCGTGKSTLPMLERGWKVTACDNSAGMLAELERKAGGEVRIEMADILALPKLGEFDLVLCLGDVLNYCAAEADLTLAFEGIRRNLAPGGLVLFDLNTLLSYRTFYAETQTTEVDGHVVAWRGRGNGTATSGLLAESVMEIADPDGIVTRSVHRQRHLDEAEIRTKLVAAGLECLDTFGQGFDAVLEQPIDETRHTKSIFIAKACPRQEERR